MWSRGAALLRFFPLGRRGPNRRIELLIPDSPIPTTGINLHRLRHMDSDDSTLVLRPGLLRLLLLSITLVFCACIFLFMAAVAVAIKVDSLIVRSALFLVALVLVALAVYLLLLLRTTIIRVEVGPRRLKLRM